MPSSAPLPISSGRTYRLPREGGGTCGAVAAAGGQGGGAGVRGRVALGTAWRWSWSAPTGMSGTALQLYARNGCAGQARAGQGVFPTHTPCRVGAWHPAGRHVCARVHGPLLPATATATCRTTPTPTPTRRPHSRSGGWRARRRAPPPQRAPRARAACTCAQRQPKSAPRCRAAETAARAQARRPRPAPAAGGWRCWPAAGCWGRPRAAAPTRPRRLRGRPSCPQRSTGHNSTPG